MDGKYHHNSQTAHNMEINNWLLLYLPLLENALADLPIIVFCFLKEKIIYPLKDIRLLCIVVLNLVPSILTSEHLSACNQHTMTLTNNKWSTTPHHNVELIPDIAPQNTSNVERLGSAEICFSPYLHLFFFSLRYICYGAYPLLSAMRPLSSLPPKKEVFLAVILSPNSNAGAWLDIPRKWQMLN